MPAKTIVLTGTNLTPAWALMEQLHKHGYKIVYLGRSRSMLDSRQPAAEKQLLADTPVEFHPLLTVRWPWAALTLGWSLFEAVVYLIKHKALAVVSFGGNVALPVALAAKFIGIPLVIHEQTFGAGLTSRLTAPLAKFIAISWPESRRFFPAKKTVLIGNPLRLAVVAAKRKKPGNKKLTLYITGGNQGSLTINTAVTQILPELLKHYQIYHQFGLVQHEALWLKQSRWAATLPEKLKKNYYLKRWFSSEELTEILALRPLVIGRAGANTITELSFLNLTAVIIPLPTAAKNEQLTNARYLEKRGLALVLPQNRLNPESLKAAISRAQKTLPLKTKSAAPAVSAASDKLYQLVIKAVKGV